MRLPPAILGNAEEVLREILRFAAPADVTLSRYFKDHPRLGGRERGAIAECIYSCCATSASTPTSPAGGGATMRRLVLLGMADAVGVESLGGLTEDEPPSSSASRKSTASCCRQAARQPAEWLYDKLVAQYGEEETLQLAAVLNTPAPLDLRVKRSRPTAKR
jgi:16S rRNA (cytosine967-C5)-methyltransferase